MFGIWTTIATAGSLLRNKFRWRLVVSCAFGGKTDELAGWSVGRETCTAPLVGQRGQVSLRPPSGCGVFLSQGSLAVSGDVLGLGEVHAELRTTVMLQHIPYHLTGDDVCRALDGLGLAYFYDALAMPQSRKRRQNLGYAFVNFVHPDCAAACIRHCSGRPLQGTRGEWTCFADYAKRQGAAAVIGRMSSALAKRCERPADRIDSQQAGEGQLQ